MMGAIADRVRQMRGCSLAMIVEEIEAMEALALNVGADDFKAFWEHWPNKVGKPVAKRAYDAARKRGHPHSVIMAGLVRYIQDKPPDRPWLNPATFLNQERFNDAPAPVSTAKPSKTSELRNDLRQRIENGQGSENPGPVRRISERQSFG